MSNENKPVILYVDDEEGALKYFKRINSANFDVLTAPNVSSARKVLNEKSDKICIVITDQRMPGESGTELLTELRLIYPHILRILTTAYSDLDAAIAAVNEGAIFHYIVKPWNIPELKLVLKRAHAFLSLQEERDQLLAQKLSVLQRMLISDRVRILTLFAREFGSLQNAFLAALTAFLKAAPTSLKNRWQSNPYFRLTGAASTLSQFTLSEDKIITDIVDEIRDQANLLSSAKGKAYNLNTELIHLYRTLSTRFDGILQARFTEDCRQLVEGMGDPKGTKEPIETVFCEILQLIDPTCTENAKFEYSFNESGSTLSLSVPSTICNQQPNWFATLTDNEKLAPSISLLCLFFAVHANRGVVESEFQGETLRSLSIYFPGPSVKPKTIVSPQEVNPVKDIEETFLSWDLSI